MNFRPFGSIWVYFCKDVGSAVQLWVLNEAGWHCKTKSMSLFFVLVYKKPLFYLLRELSGSLKCTGLAACSFIGTILKLSQFSKQTADWWMYWVALWKRGPSSRRRKTLVKIFFSLSLSLCNHWVWNRVHFGHSWNENVYFCTYAKCLFVAEASPSVQFVTASLGNVVMEKN